MYAIISAHLDVIKEKAEAIIERDDENKDDALEIKSKILEIMILIQQQANTND